MWWITVFCFFIVTRLTSEYRLNTVNDYPKCNVTARPEDYTVVSTLVTYVNTCPYQKTPCICEVETEQKGIYYDAKNCSTEFHPKGNCQAVIFCYGRNRYLQICRSGTMLNPQKLSCDHPQNVQCTQKPSYPPCSRFMRETGKFPDIISGCKSYFECTRGKITKRTCPPGLIFDTWLHQCNKPFDSICGCDVSEFEVFGLL